MLAVLDPRRSCWSASCEHIKDLHGTGWVMRLRNVRWKLFGNFSTAVFGLHAPLSIDAFDGVALYNRKTHCSEPLFSTVYLQVIRWDGGECQRFLASLIQVHGCNSDHGLPRDRGGPAET